jgi:molybdopterin/thiamine biosynthesis adenylyltransferase
VDGRVAGLERSGTVLTMPSAIASALLDRSSSSSPFLAGDLGRLLLDHGFATTDEPDDSGDRNAVFTNVMCAGGERNTQHRFAEQEFVILGCGGVGANVAVALAALGARRMLLIDGDRIESSNLNRLLWATAAEVGAPKCDALAHHLSTRFGAAAEPVAEWATHDMLTELWCSAGPRLGRAIWIIAVDDARTARAVATFLHHHQTAGHVHAGYIGVRCVVGPFVLDRADPCAFCDASAYRLGTADHVAPSAAPNNLLVASMLSAQLLRVVGLGADATVLRGRRWVLDLVSGTARLVDIPKSEGCEVCA